jgi:hypothetical protein
VLVMGSHCVHFCRWLLWVIIIVGSHCGSSLCIGIWWRLWAVAFVCHLLVGLGVFPSLLSFVVVHSLSPLCIGNAVVSVNGMAGQCGTSGWTIDMPRHCQGGCLWGSWGGCLLWVLRVVCWHGWCSSFVGEVGKCGCRVVWW